MATGPEHYREAERILRDRPTQAHIAQVHATLALAAAAAMNLPHPDGGMMTVDWEAWRDAASAYKPSERAS